MKFQLWASTQNMTMIVQRLSAASSPLSGTSAIAARIATPTSSDQSHSRLSRRTPAVPVPASGSRAGACVAMCALLQDRQKPGVRLQE
jgi:hypothetical protein